MNALQHALEVRAALHGDRAEAYGARPAQEVFEKLVVGVGEVVVLDRGEHMPRPAFQQGHVRAAHARRRVRPVARVE